MPVRKVGKDCYQWGNQKKYCGPGAKRKATLQGIAIESSGWREAETLGKTSCCCGADISNPCACMKQPEPMQCSATEPLCPCYQKLEKFGASATTISSPTTHRGSGRKSPMIPIFCGMLLAAITFRNR